MCAGSSSSSSRRCSQTVQLTLNVPHAESETEIIDKILGSLSNAAEGDNARKKAHDVD